MATVGCKTCLERWAKQSIKWGHCPHYITQEGWTVSLDTARAAGFKAGLEEGARIIDRFPIEYTLEPAVPVLQRLAAALRRRAEAPEEP
jgi:hypothetical protein